MILRDSTKQFLLALCALTIVGCRSTAQQAESPQKSAAEKPAPAPQKTAARKPNIIFILSDDVGLDCISCYGADKFKTPNIDALARGGTRFEYCYACPLCGPSRSQFLTGRYPFRTGMISNQTGPVLKPANEIMLPKILKPAGYVTAQVGKWNQLPLQPSDWSFDEYFRFAGSGVYWVGMGPRGNYTVNGQLKRIPEGKYVPDMMHDFLTDFITRHKEQPFFVYYSMSNVHGPILRTPDSKPGSNLYADNIVYMDKLVGKLVAELERLGLRENTLLVFTGDNGTARLLAAQGGTVNGKAISGGKGQMLEGGSRVPLIINWPGVTPAGKVCHDLTDFSDFFPTFAELAGAKPPTDRPIDGRSFLPQIKGEAGNPREWIYVELQGKRYVATTRWKLNNSGEFFDMKEAPFKEIPVAKDAPDAEAAAARKHLHEVMEKLVGKRLANTRDEPATKPAPKKNTKKKNRQNRQSVAP